MLDRLKFIRSRMSGHIANMGGDTAGAESLYELVGRIITIPDFSQIRNGNETFAGNTVIDRIPECLGSQAFTSMYKFAMGCTALKHVDRLYTENVTTFVYAFHGCSQLQEIDGLITSNATTLGECFHNCSSLVRINSPLNVSKVTSQLDTTFTGCSSLEELRFSGTLKADTWLIGAPKLTLESLQSVIDSLADLTREAVPTTKRIYFGAKNTAKLSAAQLATVTDKGWTLG